MEKTNISNNTIIGQMFACYVRSHNRNNYTCILVKTVNSVRHMSLILIEFSMAPRTITDMVINLSVPA